MMVRGEGAGGRVEGLTAGLEAAGEADKTGGGAVVATGGGEAGRGAAGGATVAAAEGGAMGVDGTVKVGLTAAADAAALGAGEGAGGVAIFGVAA